MKTIIMIKPLVVLVLLLSACDSNKSKPTTVTTDTASTATTTTPPVNTPENPIIGTPKKLGTLEIAGNDFPNMMIWDEAVRACDSLGTGWRIPTKEELISIYQEKDSIGGFTNDLYWNAAESVDSLSAGCKNFFNGKEGRFSKIYACRARAVRTY